jgi:23S rRNA (guanine745-N1)-methyltransferase
MARSATGAELSLYASGVRLQLWRRMGVVLDDVVRFLRCPYCWAGLARADGMLRCQNGHTFDIARQGYVSLIPSGGRPDLGDNAAMVGARAAFLAAGHFATVAEEVAQAVSAAVATSADGCLVDVGAGTGYYLAAALGRLSSRVGIALDASKFALRRAAKAHPRIGAVACDIWRQLPVADGVAEAALNVFAPRNGAELRRILQPGGPLLVVTPNRDHLSELIGPLGLLTVDQRKDERLAEQLSPYFDLAERREHRVVVSMRHSEAAAAVAMGPSAWHIDTKALSEQVLKLADPLEVTVSVAQWTFRRADR